MDAWTQLEPLYENFDGMAKSIRRQAGGDAEDLVQGAFLKIKTRLDDGYKARNLRGLLERTLRNDLMDYLDRRKTEYEAKRALELAGHVPIGNIDAHLLALDVTDELRSMPEGRARAFVATELQGATGIEAADALATTPGAIREASHHARKRLRERLS